MLSGLEDDGPATFGDLQQSVQSARREFIQAQYEGRWNDVEGMVWTFQLGESEAKAVRSNFMESLRVDREVGVGLRFEDIVGIRIHRERDLLFAEMRTKGTFDNPISPDKQSVRSDTVYGVSKDGGKTWQFNVLECFSPYHIQILFPNFYGGKVLTTHSTDQDRTDPGRK